MIWSTSIHPTDSYFDQLEEIETDISLKKLHFEAENKDTGAATKARLDLESSTTPELVRDLIQGQVEQEIKNYRSEVEKLKRQLTTFNNKTNNEKKLTRGWGHGTTNGASKTKEISKTKGTQHKKKNSTSPKAGNQSPRAPKADAQDSTASSVNARK